MATQDESANDGKRKRAKAYYVNFRKKKHVDPRGMRPGLNGVLLTCNNVQNRGALAEIYQLLHESADRLYGNDDGDDSKTSKSEVDNDPSKELEKEISALKDNWKNYFQAVETGVKNIYFIECNKGDPYELTKSIFKDLIERKASVRFCQRLIPVTFICHSSLDDIKKCCPQYLKQYFQNDTAKECKFAISYKSRYNGDLNRDQVIATVADIVIDGQIKHQVNLDNPDVVIVIEIVRNVCCMSILDDFHQMRKYNLNEVSHHGRSEGKCAVAKTKSQEVDSTAADTTTSN
ncbi:THUMP domain-containing protein 1 [Trichoplax sp. H2]|nr:THUMP domain-containing protein 1 [Trichoplax sp. H2]|eukprot:RDD38133.1 THUMP domain-containing protein 1 [Trichoplax sp. H2]